MDTRHHLGGVSTVGGKDNGSDDGHMTGVLMQTLLAAPRAPLCSSAEMKTRNGSEYAEPRCVVI